MARSSRRSRRRFQWLRTAGGNLATENAQPDVPDGPVPEGSWGVADLLAPARAQYGELLDAGATVMAIKGYIKPRYTGATGTGSAYEAGRLGICRQSRTDITNAREQDAPTRNMAEEESWMFLNPFVFDNMEATSTMNQLWLATSDPGTHFAVNVRSHRVLHSLNTTLALWQGWFTAPNGSPGMNWDLSIGVKLP